MRGVLNQVKNNAWQIIVVEDEFDSAQMVSKILNYHGVEVFMAHNGHECLSLLREVTPTLIVMDLAMPEMDGWETLDVIRSNPATGTIPVVAVSAYYSVDVADQAIAAGFDAFFSKPLSPLSFVSSLEKLILN